MELALKNNPLNNDIAMVSMKISLIDITNGTNLSRNLGKNGGLYKLSKKIVDSNFDEIVKKGDITIIEELARFTKQEFNKNLHRYISEEDYKSITGQKLNKNSFSKMKDKFNYELYLKVIDTILKQNNITVDIPHRKLDWFIWYKNR